MGQKVNPIGLRLGINRTWDSRWFARRGEYPQAPARRPRHPRPHHEGAARGRHFEGRDRAPAQEVPRHRHDGPSRHPDRQEGRKDRAPARRPRQAHVFGSSPEHPRDQEARDRRDADRGRHCSAARAPRRVSPRHEARRPVGAAPRRRRHSYQRRGPPRRRRDRPHRMVPRRPRAAAHAESRHRFRLRRGAHGLRHHRHQGLGLQGRDHRARPDGLRQEAYGNAGKRLTASASRRRPQRSP